MGDHPLRLGTNDKRRCTTPIQAKSAVCTRKSTAKIHAAGLMRVKNAAWYANPDQAQCAARRALIQRSGGRRAESSSSAYHNRRDPQPAEGRPQRPVVGDKQIEELLFRERQLHR